VKRAVISATASANPEQGSIVGTVNNAELRPEVAHAPPVGTADPRGRFRD
jgi:hypothetical protein